MIDQERKRKRARSTSALLWLSVLLGFLGLIVISPAGRFFFLAIATLFAAMAIPFAQGRPRVVAILISLALFSGCVVGYPEYRQHMSDYLEKAGPRR